MNDQLQILARSSPPGIDHLSTSSPTGNAVGNILGNHQNDARVHACCTPKQWLRQNTGVRCSKTPQVFSWNRLIGSLTRCESWPAGRVVSLLVNLLMVTEGRKNLFSSLHFGHHCTDLPFSHHHAYPLAHSHHHAYPLAQNRCKLVCHGNTKKITAPARRCWPA